jgi:hypothetical protein
LYTINAVYIQYFNTVYIQYFRVDACLLMRD